MRLFIAIDLPEDIIKYVSGLQSCLDNDSARLIPAKSYHLTLKFLGETDEKDLSSITELLGRIRFNRITLSTSGIGVFRDFSHINVIWLGLKENGDLISLHKRIEECLIPFDFLKEFDFHPHITLARVSYVNDRDRLKKNIESIRTEEKEFAIDKFTLYRSTITASGPIYSKMKEFRVS
jgi:2'-5' RNA ligase